MKKGRWSSSEHDLFLVRIYCHRKEWKKVAAHVATHSITQVRAPSKSHFKLPKVAAPVVISTTNGGAASSPILIERAVVATPDEPVLVSNFDCDSLVIDGVSLLKDTPVYK